MGDAPANQDCEDFMQNKSIIKLNKNLLLNNAAGNL